MGRAYRLVARHAAAMAWALATASGIGCSHKTTQAGGLEVIVESDMPTPSAFNVLHMVVEQQKSGSGWSTPPVLDNFYVISPTGATLPTTVSIAAGTSPYQGVRVTVSGLMGGRSGTLIVQRVVETQVPTDRVAALTVLLASVCAGKFDCPVGDSCQPAPQRGRAAGSCGSNAVDVATLPAFSEDALKDAGVASVRDGSLGAGRDAQLDTARSIDDASLDEPNTQADAQSEVGVAGTEDAALSDGPATSDGNSPDACTDECTADLTRCDPKGNAVQRCVRQAGGCSQWTTSTTCGANQTCSGSGAATCACKSTICSKPGTTCEDAQTLATCAADSEGCIHVMATSACGSPQSCSGISPSAVCSLTCTSSCSRDQTACVSGKLVACTLGNNGCWSYGTPAACPSARQSCTGAAGSAVCSCNADALCSSVSPVCANGAALANCAQDAQGCLYQASSTSCTNGACSAGACCTNTCTQGQSSCGANGLRACVLGSNGCWALGSGVACGARQSCAGNAGSAACTCNADPACTSANVCTDSSVAICASDGQGCTYSVACGSGLVCERKGGALCADPNWAEWPVPNSQADVNAGAPNLESYKDNGDRTVTDNVTGLMWEQETLAGHITQSAATTYCQGLTLAGHSGWRLPTMIELLSIVDYGAFDPSINKAFFKGAESGFYWSSTLAFGGSAARYIYFNNGYTDGVPLSISPTGAVRCVR